jgi:A/G-specific adenine glycosylase
LLLNNVHGEWLLQRRPPSGIWGGLWSFPELANPNEADAWCASAGLRLKEVPAPLAPLVHTFTHFRLTITPLVASVHGTDTRCMDSDRWLWYNSATPAGVGLATPVAKILALLSSATRGI